MATKRRSTASQKGRATWFGAEFGFEEKASPSATRAMFSVSPDLTQLTSKATRHTFHVGKFETPSLRELQQRLQRCRRGDARAAEEAGGTEAAPQGVGDTLVHLAVDGGESEDAAAGPPGELRFLCISDDVRALHKAPKNRGAVFQAASQFNCLEMVGPSVKPEAGVTRYMDDKTQGPACAMMCAAGTVFRNYFWQGRGQLGGNERQINTLGDVEVALKNESHGYWTMTNGYLLPSRRGAIADVAERLGREPYPLDPQQRSVADVVVPVGDVPPTAASRERGAGATAEEGGSEEGWQDVDLDLPTGPDTESAEEDAAAANADTPGASGGEAPEGEGEGRTEEEEDASYLPPGPGSLREAVKQRVRVGIHWDTDVSIGMRSAAADAAGTDPLPSQRVCQVYCSAVPCSYVRNTTSREWAPLARVILDSAYESTLTAAAILAEKRGSRVKVFLTTVGGGAFGNRSTWIAGAVAAALRKHRSAPLDVHLVFFRRGIPRVYQDLEKSFRKQQRQTQRDP